MQPNNFGPTGDIPALGFTVTMITADPGSNANMANQIAGYDIVFINYGNFFGQTNYLPALKAFNDAGGVVIYSCQDATFCTNFYSTFYGSGTGVTYTYSGAFNNVPIGTRTSTGLTQLPTNDPIANGPFSTNAGTLPLGAVATKLTPLRLSVESSNLCYSDNVTYVSTIVPLSRVQGNGHDYVFAWYDSVKGLMFFGDSGWNRGENSTSAVINASVAPNRVDYPIDGRQNPASDAVLSSNVTEPAGISQNSYIFANSIAWAMKWVAMHKP